MLSMENRCNSLDLLIFFYTFSINDYRNDGKWVGNCSDPKEYFESIAYKLEDLVASVGYKYFDEDVEDYLENNPKKLNNLWTHSDTRAYGRCFSLVPTTFHIKLGIKEIQIGVKSDVDAFFHTPENFITAEHDTDRLQKQRIILKHVYRCKVSHDLFKMIDDGKSCMSHPKYSIDKCANEEVERKSLENFGCTSPYGSNKTNICQDPDVISKVIEMYTEKIEKRHHTCLNPCSFFSIMTMKTSDKKHLFLGSKGKFQIIFKKNIRVTSGYFLYNGLSLLSQIGGCIGLGRTMVWAFGKSLNFAEKLKLI